MENTSRKQLTKAFIHGKSYEDMVYRAQQLKTDEPVTELLAEIAKSNSNKRTQIATRDLILSTICLLVLVALILILINGKKIVMHYQFIVIAAAAWFTLFRSYYIVRRDKHKFELPNE